MAQANGSSPQFLGPVAAQSFRSTLVPTVTGTYTQKSLRVVPQRISVITNGTTPVDVFGTTNGVAGTFIAARIIPLTDANGNITLKNNPAGTETTIFTIAKGSQGAVKGSYFSAVAFSATGTAQIASSSATGDVVVEIDFIVSNPALPGAQ